VGSDPRYPDLSLRDADAVAYWDKNHSRTSFETAADAASSG